MQKWFSYYFLARERNSNKSHTIYSRPKMVHKWPKNNFQHIMVQNQHSGLKKLKQHLMNAANLCCVHGEANLFVKINEGEI